MTDRSQILRWCLVVVTALILQVGLASQVVVAGVIPDLMLLVAVCAGVTGGPQRGAIVGFWAGLLFDLARPGPLGLSALAFCVVAFSAGMLVRQVLAVRRPLVMAVVAVGSAAGELLYAAAGQMFGADTLSNHRLWAIVAVVGAVNGVLSLPVLRMSRWAEGPGAPAGGMIGVLDG